MAEMNRQMEAGNVQLAWFRTQEEYLARIDKLRLIDDDFFSEALDGKLEAVEYILQTVLERNDIVVLETKAQVEYKSATKRSIRLDIKAVDRNQEHFDVETPVGRLMHDFYCTKSEDMYSKVLADEVKYLKETEGGRRRMCRILEEMCEEVAGGTEDGVGFLREAWQALSPTVDSFLLIVLISAVSDSADCVLDNSDCVSYVPYFQTNFP